MPGLGCVFVTGHPLCGPLLSKSSMYRQVETCTSTSCHSLPIHACARHLSSILRLVVCVHAGFKVVDKNVGGMPFQEVLMEMGRSTFCLAVGVLCLCML